MAAGQSSLTRNFLRRISMELLLTVEMVFAEGFIPESLYIQLTIPKSEWSHFSSGGQLLMDRVLIATIRDKGQCPCPRCKISQNEIREFATAKDLEIRRTQARRDDEDRQKKVEKARKFIYEKGYVVNSSHVEDLLKEESLVPTKVCISTFPFS